MIENQNNFKTYQALEDQLDYILQSPKNEGEIKLMVIRPKVDDRKVLDEATITQKDGIIGDNWKVKNSFSPPGPPHIEKQITIMNARCIEIIAEKMEDWPLAGDQFYVDFDLSEENIPAGTILNLGEEVQVKVSAIPHNGCKKFAARFGTDSVKFINSKIGKANQLRGINAQVIKEGKVKKGDKIFKAS